MDPEVEKEIARRRDILASVAMLDGLEKYVGREVSVVDVRRMTSGELDTLFELYQEKSGQELVKDGMDVIVSGIVKGLSYFLKFDDELALKKGSHGE